MTKVLIFGAGGMIGHKVWQQCQRGFDVWATLRSHAGLPAGLFEPSRVLAGVDAVHADSVVAAFAALRSEGLFPVEARPPVERAPVPTYTRSRLE